MSEKKKWMGSVYWIGCAILIVLAGSGSVMAEEIGCQYCHV